MQQEVNKHSVGTINYATVIKYSFTQYSLKRGLKELGKKGETAVAEEMYHLHMRDTFRPKSVIHLT